MKYLFLLFIIVPAVEIGLFIIVGKAIGAIATVALIIGTGILGAYIAKKQGLGALRKVQEQLRIGHPPGDALLEGVCVLMGGLLLLVPGFVTDVAGALLLIPINRKIFKPVLLNIVRKWLSRRQVQIYR